MSSGSSVKIYVNEDTDADDERLVSTELRDMRSSVSVDEDTSTREASSSLQINNELDSEAMREQEQASFHQLEAAKKAGGKATEEQLSLRNIKLPTRKQLTWLVGLARPDICFIVLGTVFLFVGSGINLLIPQFMGTMIDIVMKPAEGGVNTLVFTLMGLFVISALATFGRAYFFQVAGDRVVARLRKSLFDNIIIQDISFFDVVRTGELTNRLASDTKVLESAITVNVSVALRYVVQFVGGVGFLFYLSWKLTLIILASVPVMLIGAIVYGRYVKRMSKDVQDALAKSSEVAEESLSNVRVVRAFGQETKQRSVYGNAIDESFRLSRKLATASGIFQAITLFVGNGGIVFVLWFGGSLVSSGELSVGSLTTFLMYTLYVAMALGMLSSLYWDIMRALGATERVYQLITKVPDINVEGGGRTITTDWAGKIEFTNVGFHYPARPDHPVLSDINLSLEPGQVVALVGHSGGGKSTIVSLLLRFYDPTTGYITVDGVPLSELDVLWLRDRMAVVNQEPVLFATTIADNIAYGQPDALLSDIETAARQANAHDFIMSFPEGYQTLVGERGVRLSGGQKQRVAIARALLKNPSILLLDEATSALDADSEYLVQQALERLMRGRTVLIIAHRLSTVKNANLVLVVQKGTVAEQGTHSQLIQRDGIYKKLVEKQLLKSDP